MADAKPYYSHIVHGTCTKHGAVACECVHPRADAKESDLEVYCLVCRAEQKTAAEAEKPQGLGEQSAAGESQA